VDDLPAAAVQDAAQVVERPANIDGGHIDLPILLEGSGPVLEELLLPAIEHRRLEPLFDAQLRNRHLLNKIPSEDGDLLLSFVVLPLLLHAFAPLS